MGGTVTLKAYPNGKILSEDGVGNLYFCLFLRVEAGILSIMMPLGRSLEGLADAIRAISLSLFSIPIPITDQWSVTSSPPYFPLWPLIVTITPGF